MTIKECIDIVDNQKPNQYTVKDKVMWLSFLDETIINDVLKTHEGYDGRYDLFTGYSEDKLSETLIAHSPYDRMYTQYLKMRIDGENGETARYNNSMVMFNSYMQEYKRYYNKTHMPIDYTAKSNKKNPTTTQMGVTDAQLDGLVKELTFVLTEYFSDTVSEDKIYDAASKYIQNNWEQFRGKDGKTPVIGVDYFTEEDKQKIMDFVQSEADKVLPEAKKYAETAEKNAKAYADEKVGAIKQVEVTMDAEDTDETKAASIRLVATMIMAYDEQFDKLEHNLVNGDNEVRLDISTAAVNAREYTDTSIQQAILDSWEVGV